MPIFIYFCQKYYHFVYKTTCLITNKFYIGKHSTSDLNDGYYGSGRLLKSSLKQYGRKNHIVEHIAYFVTSDDAYKFESSFLKEHLNNKSCLNLIDGGKGFSPDYSKKIVHKNLKDQNYIEKRNYTVKSSVSKNYLLTLSDKSQLGFKNMIDIEYFIKSTTGLKAPWLLLNKSLKNNMVLSIGKLAGCHLCIVDKNGLNISNKPLTIEKFNKPKRPSSFKCLLITKDKVEICFNSILDANQFCKERYDVDSYNSIKKSINKNRPICDGILKDSQFYLLDKNNEITKKEPVYKTLNKPNMSNNILKTKERNYKNYILEFPDGTKINFKLVSDVVRWYKEQYGKNNSKTFFSYLNSGKQIKNGLLKGCYFYSSTLAST